MNLFVVFDGRYFPVTSVKDAAKKWCVFRDTVEQRGEGGVRQLGNGVNVYRKGELKPVARISYNGRIWPGKETEVNSHLRLSVKQLTGETS